MLIDKGETSLIDEVIREKVVPVLIDILADGETAELQLMAAKSLANIARGKPGQAHIIIVEKGISPLMDKLETGNDEIQETAMLALSNICGNSVSSRDALVDCGAFLKLWKLLKTPFEPRLTVLRKASLALSKFCYGEPPATEVLNELRKQMPVLKQLLMITDQEVTTNACLTFSLIATKANMIQAVDEVQICPRLIELLKKPMPECFETALLTLAEIAAQNQDSAQRIIGEDLQWLQSFFTDQNNIKIVRQALRLISNLTWTELEIQAVISAGLVLSLVNSSRAESDFRKEAAQAILNITNKGSLEQIRSLVNEGCIPPLCDLLTCADPMTVYLLKWVEKHFKCRSSSQGNG